MPKPHRVRRVAKWVGLGLVVAFAATWALSFRFSAAWNCSRGWLNVTNGGLHGMWPVESYATIHIATPGIYGAMGDKVVWLPSIIKQRSKWRAKIPIWLFLLVVALPTMFLWRRDRRIPPGHCSKCRYDLTGNVSGRCPECGKAV